MSTSQFDTVRRNNFQSAIMSFLGMIVAIPVAVVIVSNMQPAQALATTPQSSDYEKYAQAYTAGVLANVQNTSAAPVSDGNCSEPVADTTTGAPTAVAASVKLASHSSEKSAMPSSAQLVKKINNSYKHYTTNVKNVHNVKNVKNIDSNNTVKTNVMVSNSNGAVVSTNSSVSGNNKNNVKVNNYKSNNNVGSYNNSTDSHDVTIKDSFNHETNKTTVIKDSFNKKTEIKVEDSFNKTKIDKSVNVNLNPLPAVVPVAS